MKIIRARFVIECLGFGVNGGGVLINTTQNCINAIVETRLAIQKECHNDVLFAATWAAWENRHRYTDCVILTRQTCLWIKTNKCRRMWKNRKQTARLKSECVLQRLIVCYTRAIKKQKGDFYYTILCSTENVFFHEKLHKHFMLLCEFLSRLYISLSAHSLPGDKSFVEGEIAAVTAVVLCFMSAQCHEV